MKTSISLPGSLCAILVLAATARADLIAQFEFEEGVAGGSGGTILDSSPNSLNGTAKQRGAIPLPKYVRSKFGLGLGMTGQTYVEVPDSRWLDFTSGITIEAFIRPENVFRQQVLVRKYGGAGGTAGDGGWFLDIAPTGRISLSIFDDQFRLFGNTVLKSDEFYHVAGTWDGETMRVYVNHELDGQMSYDGPLRASNSKLGIGALIRDNGSIGQGYRGLIDQVRIHDEALSPRDFNPVPEPSTFLLAALGILGLVAFCWRRRNNAISPVA